MVIERTERQCLCKVPRTLLVVSKASVQNAHDASLPSEIYNLVGRLAIEHGVTHVEHQIRLPRGHDRRSGHTRQLAIDIEQEKYQIIVVEHLSHLERRIRVLHELITKAIEHGIRVIASADNFDTCRDDWDHVLFKMFVGLEHHE